MITRFHRARIDCVVQYPAPRDSEESREANYTILFSFQNVEPGPRRAIRNRQEPLSGDPFLRVPRRLIRSLKAAPMISAVAAARAIYPSSCVVDVTKVIVSKMAVNGAPKANETAAVTMHVTSKPAGTLGKSMLMACLLYTSPSPRD